MLTRDTEGDYRSHFTRFRDEAVCICSPYALTRLCPKPDTIQILKHNLGLVEALTAVAEKKKVTSSQLALAWVSSLGARVIPIPGSSYVPQLHANHCLFPDDPAPL